MSDRTKLPKGTRKTPARKFPKWARHEIEDAIERLLGLLDLADGDPDLEPSLGSPNPRYLYEGGPLTDVVDGRRDRALPHRRGAGYPGGNGRRRVARRFTPLDPRRDQGLPPRLRPPRPRP